MDDTRPATPKELQAAFTKGAYWRYQQVCERGDTFLHYTEYERAAADAYPEPVEYNEREVKGTRYRVVGDFVEYNRYGRWIRDSTFTTAVIDALNELRANPTHTPGEESSPGLNVFITPMRSFNMGKYLGELHITHNSREETLKRLTHDLTNRLAEADCEHVVEHHVRDREQAERFVRRYPGYWVCWCDDPKSYE